MTKNANHEINALEMNVCMQENEEEVWKKDSQGRMQAATKEENLNFIFVVIKCKNRTKIVLT